MKKILPLIPVVALLSLADTPSPPSYLTALTETFYAQLDQPVVELAVPNAETNELVVTSQTNLNYTAAASQGLFYVGCTNITEIAWQTQPNLSYKLMVKTNAADPWYYTKVKVIGDGKVFHFYSVADQNRTFTIFTQ